MPDAFKAKAHQYQKSTVITAAIEANNNGTSDAKTRSRLKISMAKTIAATGAKNMDDIAPAVTTNK